MCTASKHGPTTNDELVVSLSNRMMDFNLVNFKCLYVLLQFPSTFLCCGRSPFIFPPHPVKHHFRIWMILVFWDIFLRFSVILNSAHMRMNPNQRTYPRTSTKIHQCIVFCGQHWPSASHGYTAVITVGRVNYQKNILLFYMLFLYILILHCIFIGIRNGKNLLNMTLVFVLHLTIYLNNVLGCVDRQLTENINGTFEKRVTAKVWRCLLCDYARPWRSFIFWQEIYLSNIFVNEWRKYTKDRCLLCNHARPWRSVRKVLLNLKPSIQFASPDLWYGGWKYEHF